MNQKLTQEMSKRKNNVKPIFFQNPQESQRHATTHRVKRPLQDITHLDRGNHNLNSNENKKIIINFQRERLSMLEEQLELKFERRFVREQVNKELTLGYF
jgi:hypothetical protein